MAALNELTQQPPATHPPDPGPPDPWQPQSASDALLDPTLISSLAAELTLPAAIARLLVARGSTTPAAARALLHPAMDQLHDPLLLRGMAAAVDRLLRALELDEPILIYGDYDVDGTVATVLLKTALERAAAARGRTAQVRYHIPHRLREGYGIQEARLEAAAAEGIRLVVSVDTGIRAFAAADEARRLGLDLIVTDHHLPEDLGLPDALAVINPNQPGCDYPFAQLCGAGVAFKLAQALLEATAPDPSARLRLREKTLPSFLKLLAIATIADAVPLIDENRVIAALGLRELRRPAQVGLAALLDLAGLDSTQPISATDVAFRLAPRLNAAGRMDVAADVVELFLTRDPDRGRDLAAKLHRLNDDRRASEAEALRVIEHRLDALHSAGQDLPACLVLDDAPCPDAPDTATSSAPASRRWHRGVIGILASRVVDRTGRPALVLAHEDGQAYGSGRSVPGFQLLDALTAADHAGTLFTRFGGHAHAVGFSLPSASVPLLRERMEALAAAHAPAFLTAHAPRYDIELSLAELTADFFTALESLGPFGIGHPEPVFLTRDLRLDRPPRIIQDRHLRLSFHDADSAHRLGGMAWSRRTDWVSLSRGLNWTHGTALDVLYRLQRNRRPEFAGWDMEILALRPAPSP